MKSLSSRLSLFVMLCASLFAGYAAAQQVTLSRDSPLLAEPTPGASVVAELRQGATAEVVGKQGAWLNVKTASGTGWVYSFNVSFGSSGQTAAPSSGVGSLFGRPKPPVTAVIGIRGLDAEDLKKAAFDGAQLTLLDSYAASNQDAERAARRTGLSAIRVEYLAR